MEEIAARGGANSPGGSLSQCSSQEAVAVCSRARLSGGRLAAAARVVRPRVTPRLVCRSQRGPFPALKCLRAYLPSPVSASLRAPSLPREGTGGAGRGRRGGSCRPRPCRRLPPPVQQATSASQRGHGGLAIGGLEVSAPACEGECRGGAHLPTPDSHRVRDPPPGGFVLTTTSNNT
ncbi:hypothetical protein O3P69_001068 [Scylla paramamosain]|uniref:Uncharacterized protein n=1 Tax=Scylla paramamosain TaxID=85552 RepID=A0AAW0UP99_SCYPA